MCYRFAICKCRIVQLVFLAVAFCRPMQHGDIEHLSNGRLRRKGEFHRALYPGLLKYKDCPLQAWSYPAARLLPKHTFFSSCYSSQQWSEGMLYAFRKMCTPSLSMGALQNAMQSVCQISFWCHLKSDDMEMYHITAQPGTFIPLLFSRGNFVL